MSLDTAKIKRELETIWAPGISPKTPATVSPVLQLSNDIVEQIKDEFGKISASPAVVNSSAKGLAEELSVVLMDIEAERDAAKSLGFTSLLSALNTLYDTIHKWRLLTLGLGGVANENARARFADAGNWAMHFSTVRMTMTTFFITISWGVISLKWDDYDISLVVTAWVVWLTALGFLGLFTYATYKKTLTQKYFQGFIPTMDSSKISGLKSKDKWLIWSPVGVFVIVTFGFGWLCYEWGHHESQKKVQWITMVEPSSTDPFKSITNVAGATNVTFNIVPFSDISADIQTLTSELRNMETQMMNVSASRAIQPTAQPVNLEPLRQELANIENVISNLATTFPTNVSVASNSLLPLVEELKAVEQAVSNSAAVIAAKQPASSTNATGLLMKNTGLFFHVGSSELKAK